MITIYEVFYIEEEIIDGNGDYEYGKGVKKDNPEWVVFEFEAPGDMCTENMLLRYGSKGLQVLWFQSNAWYRLQVNVTVTVSQK